MPGWKGAPGETGLPGGGGSGEMGWPGGGTGLPGGGGGGKMGLIGDGSGLLVTVQGQLLNVKVVGWKILNVTLLTQKTVGA